MFSRKSKSPKTNNNNYKSGKSSRKSDSTLTSGSVTTTDYNESDSDSIPSLSMLPSLVTVPSIIPPSIIVGSNRNSIISSATVTLKPKSNIAKEERSPSPTFFKVKTTRSANPPSDFVGNYRTFLSGWDSIVDSSGNRLTPKPSVSPSMISSFTNVTSEANKAANDTSSMSVNSMPSSSPIPNQSSSSNVTSKSAKESFFLNANEFQDGVGFSLNRGLRTPTTPTSGPNVNPSSSFSTYRCANMDRLSLRPGIYDLSVPSPEAAQAYTNFVSFSHNVEEDMINDLLLFLIVSLTGGGVQNVKT